MRKLCLVFASTLLLFIAPSIASANHFRSGTMTWSPVEGEARTVLVKAQVVWTNNHGHIPSSTAIGGVVTNRITIYWGDGQSTSAAMRVISRDETANDVFTEIVSDLDSNGSYETVGLKHTYAADGDYTAYWGSSARESANSQTSGTWRNETLINIGNGNTGPVSAVPAIVQVRDNTEFSYQLSAVDSDGDDVRFRLGTQQEFYNNGSNLPVTAPTGLTISSAGLIEWDVRDETLATSIGARWQMTVMVEDLDGEGAVKSKTPLDFVLLISDASNDPPVFTSVPGTTQVVSVGQTVNITLDGNDPDWESGASPSITVLNPPSTDAEIWSTSLSQDSADASLDVTFTPDESMGGNSYVVNFRIADQNGATGVASVTFQVPAAPANEAPTDIALDNIQVIDDRAENGTVIGDLSGTDPDEDDTVTLTLVDDANGAFAIVDGQLVVANSNSLVSPSQTVTVRATDDDGATYEEDFEITVSYVPPIIRDIVVTQPNSYAPEQIRVTWNKEDADSSHLDYGLNTTYGHTEEDLEDTVDLDLLDCATYDYRIRLEKAGNFVNGNNQDMTTSGCVGNAAVVTQNRGDVDEDSGGSVELMSNGKGTKITVPTNFKEGAVQAQFQVKKLEQEEVIDEISTPSAKNLAGEHIYDFLALTDVTTKITEFDEPITITMMYEDGDIDELIEETLRIYRWHDEQWEVLESCNINESTNTITCLTTKFSVFGLFGQGQNTNTPAQKNGSGKSKTIRWAGMARGDFQDTGATVTKHNFEEAYAKSKDQIAMMNTGFPGAQTYTVNRWGEHVFAGYLSGRIGLEQFPYRFQNMVRFGSGSLTAGRGINHDAEPEGDQLLLASAPKGGETIEDQIFGTQPRNEGWADEYQYAKDRFTEQRVKNEFFASAPVGEDRTIQEDQVVTHENQRNYYRKKGVVDRKRDTSMLTPSRMDATKDMKTIRVTVAGKKTSMSMSQYLQNNLFGNVDGQNDTSSKSLVLLLLGSLVILAGAMLWSAQKNKNTNIQ